MFVTLLISFSLATVAWSQLCAPEAENAVKVRLSLRSALGNDHYIWDDHELFLFKATLAYTMRKSGYQTAEVHHVHICNETPRVSFWFVAVNPENNISIPKSAVTEAIKQNRGRINSAFLLDDNTLEFVGIPVTLAPPVEPPVPVWLILFGIVMGIVVIGIITLIILGIKQRKKKANEVQETADDDDGHAKIIENGTAIEINNVQEGRSNEAFEDDYENERKKDTGNVKEEDALTSF